MWILDLGVEIFGADEWLLEQIEEVGVHRDARDRIHQKIDTPPALVLCITEVYRSNHNAGKKKQGPVSCRQYSLHDRYAYTPEETGTESEPGAKCAKR